MYSDYFTNKSKVSIMRANEIVRYLSLNHFVHNIFLYRDRSFRLATLQFEELTFPFEYVLKYYDRTDRRDDTFHCIVQNIRLEVPPESF